MLDRLCTQREALVDATLAAPYQLPAPPAVRDDGRPEAGRRDALALLELVDEVIAESQEQRRRAEQRLAEAGGELAGLGDPAELAERIAALRAVAAGLGRDARARRRRRAVLRLQRAGVRSHRRGRDVSRGAARRRRRPAGHRRGAGPR